MPVLYEIVMFVQDEFMSAFFSQDGVTGGEQLVKFENA